MLSNRFLYLKVQLLKVSALKLLNLPNGPSAVGVNKIEVAAFYPNHHKNNERSNQGHNQEKQYGAWTLSYNGHKRGNCYKLVGYLCGYIFYKNKKGNSSQQHNQRATNHTIVSEENPTTSSQFSDQNNINKS